MIIKAKAGDLSSAAALALRLWPDNDFDGLKNEMETVISDKNSVIFLAFIDGEPVGFAQCQLRHDYVEGTEGSPVGYLEGIFVDERYRKRGLARELLEYCESWAKEMGCSEFASDCELHNTESFAFHLKVGFEEANRIICFAKKL